MTQKSLIKMQISPIKNQNFEKPCRKLSNRTKGKILKKTFFGYHSKKFGSAYAQSPRKCSNIEILAKIEGKEANFFSEIYEGHIRIWFGSKKNSKLSHACVPLSKSCHILQIGPFYFKISHFQRSLLPWKTKHYTLFFYCRTYIRCRSRRSAKNGD